MQIKGQIVDLHQRKIYPAEVQIEQGRISRIQSIAEAPDRYILPGFVDAHIHIESSMLVPAEFAKIAVKHGTIATVSDPHEIANVLGEDGVHFMIQNGKTVPLKFNFGAPSCVPATQFETAGAIIDSEGIDRLLQNPDILYLAEMMNFPGVLFKDEEVMAKIALAHKYQKPVDGHAPGLRGEQAKTYIDAGILTDHECVSYEEAKEKLELGMKILIREGSAAKNYEALIPLLKEYPDRIMFCSDDKHPDDLLLGHINQLAARAVADGYELFDVLRATCIHPVEHYGLNVGLLREGDAADFVIVDDLQTLQVQQTVIDGVSVFDQGAVLFESRLAERPNHFNIGPIKTSQLSVPQSGEGKVISQEEEILINVIEALDGELITRKKLLAAKIEGNNIVSDPSRDILKFAVVNRYQEAPIAKAFIQNFGLKSGAIASCVGHDSHNILAVGVDDESIRAAINLIIAQKGGIAAVGLNEEKVLPLPIAGIMSELDGETVGHAYAELDAFAKQLGSKLRAPFMTLSFMALLVIPALKLSDKGLFDGEKFEFVSLVGEL
ncbi:MAG: adenine deaminase [Bacteroidia bacterium]